MNTVITKLVDADTDEVVGFDMDDGLGDCVVRSLIRNNAFCPNIDRVVYNTKVDELVAKKGPDGNPLKDEDGRVVKELVPLENPVLVTVAYFVDGTKVTVKNSDKDSIWLVDQKVKLSDGTEKIVKTASPESKEIGLVYALAKRIVCEFDECGNVKNAGFAKFLRDAIAEAHVQDVEDAKLSAERKISKARAKENGAKQKQSRSRESLRSVVNRLSDTVGSLGNLVKSLLPQPETEQPK